MNDSAKYLIVQYTDDAFRRETKNLGVIVVKGGSAASRFLGEAENERGLDMRLPRWVRYPDIYRQWFDYWRELMQTVPASELPEQLAKTNGDNFNVIEGGEVTRTNGDDARVICESLFGMLVATVGERDLLPEDAEPPAKTLRIEVSKEFRRLDIMATADPSVTHPVQAEIPVKGKRRTHTPAYYQKNDALYVMDAVNFQTRSKASAKDHAGWMAKMFDDILALPKNNACPIAIYSATSEDLKDKVVDYAIGMLTDSSSQMFNWRATDERAEFLRQRSEVARSARSGA